MNRKKYIAAYLAILGICIFLFYRFIYLRSFGYIDDVRFLSDGSIVAVDDGEYAVCIMKIKGSRIVGECMIYKDEYEDGGVYSFQNELLADGENVYLIAKEYAGDEGMERERIYSIDFKKEEASEVLQDQKELEHMLGEYEEELSFIKPYIMDGSTYSYKRIRKTSDKTIAGLSYSQKSLVKISEDSGEACQYDENLNLELNEHRIEFGELCSFDANRGQAVFGCYGSGRAYLLFYDGKELSTAYHLKSGSAVELAKEIVVLSLVLAALFFVWYLISAKGTYVLRMLRIMFISLMAGELAVMVLTIMIMNAYQTDSVKESLMMTAQIYDAMNLLEGVGDFNGYASKEQEHYGKIQQFIAEMEDLSKGTIEIANSFGDKSSIQGKVSFFGIDKENETYVNVAAGMDAQNTGNAFEPAAADCIKEAVRTKKAGSYTGYNQYGENIYCLFYPIYDENGETKGIFAIETMFDTTQMDITDLLENKFLEELMIAVFMIIFMAVSLRPLKKLRKKAVRLTGSGEYPEREKRHYRKTNEITQIAEQFDQMLEDTRQNLDEIKHLRDCYSQYFSDEILKIFGKSSMALMHLDEECELEMYVLSLKLPDTYENMDSMEGLLEKLTFMMSDKGAFILQIDSEGIVILSKKKESLSIAFGITQYDVRIGAVFDYTLLKLCIVGWGMEYRISMAYASPSRHIKLQHLQQCMNAGFIATENAFDEKEGNILSNCIGKLENAYVYEIFANTSDYIKKLLKNPMKEALNAYEEGNLEKARRLYVKVLKQDKDNVAARYYIGEIDQRENRV